MMLNHWFLLAIMYAFGIVGAFVITHDLIMIVAFAIASWDDFIKEWILG
jgi:hypothetical protein